MNLLVALCSLLTPSSYTPRAPRFSWDTLPVFFHSSIKNGPVDAANLAIAAKFPMVTIEKFQWPANASQEKTIVEVLKGVKEIDSNVSTVFYYNSVLDFPQYDLHKLMLANPLLEGVGRDLVRVVSCHVVASCTRSIFVPSG